MANSYREFSNQVRSRQRRRAQRRVLSMALLAVMVLGLAVLAVNALLGSNYLFLGWPVEGTPLTALAAHGLTGYRLALAGICTGVIALEGLAAWLAGRLRT